MIELLPLCLALLGTTPEATEAAPDGRTAVVVTLERRELPEIETMQGWFLLGGEPLRVLAVDKGPAEVLVVRDPAAQPYLRHLAGAVLDRGILQARKTPSQKTSRPLERGPHQVRVGEETVVELGTTFRDSRTLSSGKVDEATERLQRTCSLDDARVRFVSPMAAPVSRTGGQMGVFMQSRSWRPGPRGFLDFVDKVPRLDFALRLHDAIWIAGHELHASGRRRAVITWAAGGSQDESLHSAAEAADELERLRVPHFVWTFGPGPLTDAWGGPLVTTDDGVIHSETALASLDGACSEVRDALERQRVVWIEGEHPAPLIRLAPEAEGLRLAGRPPGGAFRPASPAGERR